MTKPTTLLLAAAATFALTLPALAQSSSTMPSSNMPANPPAASSSPAPMTSAPMKSMPMKKAAKPMGKKMAMGGKMKLSCGDYAWQSQDQKDCEAGNKAPPNWR